MASQIKIDLVYPALYSSLKRKIHAPEPDFAVIGTATAQALVIEVHTAAIFCKFVENLLAFVFQIQYWYLLRSLSPFRCLNKELLSVNKKTSTLFTILSELPLR